MSTKIEKVATKAVNLLQIEFWMFALYGIFTSETQRVYQINISGYKWIESVYIPQRRERRRIYIRMRSNGILDLDRYMCYARKGEEKSMLVKVGFDYEDDIEYMSCPAKVGRDIRRLQREFWDWLYDRDNDHPYWFKHEDNGEVIYGVSYRTDAFVYWLNEVRFHKRKHVARLIEVPKRAPKKAIRF